MRLQSRSGPSDPLTQAQEFLRDLPQLHNRGDGTTHSGGLNPRLGQVIIDELDELDSPTVIETGAGSSTLLFLMLGCSSVISIAPVEELGRRIHEEAKQRNLPGDRLNYINDRSEIALPRLALEGKTRCQVGFIDGNHGWPSVFVDFCYLNMMMDSGSLLFIDDVQIYACQQLMQLLTAQPEYEFVRLDGKMATFKKKTDDAFLPDWRGEPFILINTSGVVLG